MARLISVRIPATSANLGPGFDSMGLALDLWNTFELHLDETEHNGPLVEVHGEGADMLPTDASHLVIQTLLEELERLDEEPERRRRAPPVSPSTNHRTAHGFQSALLRRRSLIRIVCTNHVPCASGLGSSSTAVLAGLIFAYALAEQAQQADFLEQAGLIDRVLHRAAQIEGHGDNVGPALLGGLIAVSSQGDSVIAQRIPIPPMQVVVCVPTVNLLTREARAMLPTQLSRADAVFNIGRALLIVDALRTGNIELLAQAMGDRIHEPYRLPVIPGALDAKRAALEHGAAAVCLSGAGPGLLAFARGRHEQIGRAMQQAFAAAGVVARYWTLDTTDRGAQIEMGNVVAQAASISTCSKTGQ
ncbi:MAG: homoserine kinase [Anaerolineae bacterium]|nr:homoserine kinase [Thermoflexales bacterium]MDW8406284.1 homoserine kinase [Anaerolineae bacterium]